MRFWFFLFYFFYSSFVQAVDFDVIVIGTSPIPLCEAIYQASTGKRVLLLEQSAESGGAWKSITACGIPHVDMGCHQLVGANETIKQFLETFIGCHLVPMERPLDPLEESHEFYFSRGCYELIHNLEKIISRTNITFLLNHPVELVTWQKDQVIVTANGSAYSTNKVITTANSHFQIEGIPNVRLRSGSKIKYRHLYLLIQDPTPPRFSYLHHSYPGVARCMNLTHFVGLSQLGRQLFVFQVHNEEILHQGEAILADLKRKKLIDPAAFILQSEIYIYEQFTHDSTWYHQMPEIPKNHFELLDTSAFGSMSRYMSKWEEVMRPFRELFHD